MKLIVSLLIAVLLFVGISNAASCSSNRNAFYCALNSPPCFWKALGHNKFSCVTIRSENQLEETTTNNSVCSYLSEGMCNESEPFGCKWVENEQECVKEELSKNGDQKFCESIKGKLSCILSNCQWSDNHCHY